MRRYAIVASQNAPSTAGSGQADSSILGLVSAANVKPHLYDITFGSAATPADQAFNMKISRFTAVGTATTVTPEPLDPVDSAALASGRSNHTAAPTYTSATECLSFSIHQQNTYRWQTLPELGIVAAATANAGLGLYFDVVSGGTALCEATFLHYEP